MRFCSKVPLGMAKNMEATRGLIGFIEWKLQGKRALWMDGTAACRVSRNRLKQGAHLTSIRTCSTLCYEYGVLFRG